MSALLYGVAVLFAIGLVGVIIGALNLYDDLNRPTPQPPDLWPDVDDEYRRLCDEEAGS